MPRLLLFALVIGMTFLMLRSCSDEEKMPPAVPVEPVYEPDPAMTLLLEVDGVVARFTRDGRLLSLKDGDRKIVRPVSRKRLPFTLVPRMTEGGHPPLDPTRWDGGEIKERSVEFVWQKDDFRVTKTFSVDEGGKGLTASLRAEGFGAVIAGFEMTVLSGVPMGGEDGPPTGLVEWRADKPRFVRFAALASENKHRRAEQERISRRENEPPPDAGSYHTIRRGLSRVALLGRDVYVSVSGANVVVNEQAFRVRRGDEIESEIETWLTLDGAGGGFAGEFKMAWQTREEFRKKHPGLPAFPAREAQQYTLSGDTMEVVFSDQGASIVAAYLKGFTEAAGEDLVADNWLPILRRGVRLGDRALTLKVVGTSRELLEGIDPARDVWEVKASEHSILFTISKNGWRIQKHVWLPAPGRFDLRIEVTIQRPPGEDEKTFKFVFVGPAGLYVADAYRGTFAAEQPAGLILERPDEIEDEQIGDVIETALIREYQKAENRGRLEAIAVRGAFFVGALIPAVRGTGIQPRGTVTKALVDGIELTREVTRPDGSRSRDALRAEVSCRVDVRDGDAEQEFTLYLGPARLDDVRPLGLERIVDYGIFGFIGRGLMWLMKFFESLIGSYGIAIMLMTLVVRAALFPVSYRTQLGMQRYSRRLQKIKPELDKITEKYKSNPKKLNQERMRVMREHNVGLPLGCLTLFLQIPIWIALFAALRVEFSIRQQPFLWAADLTMPDHLFALPMFPHWFNLLPILMLVLWVWQQKTAPTPASNDPQVQAQMKMMRIMPYMFFIFLYGYASALAVYMCVSSTWGIIEGKMVRKAIAKLD